MADPTDSVDAQPSTPPLAAADHLGVTPDVPDASPESATHPEPASAPAPAATPEAAPASVSTAESVREVVYVQAPTPPKPRSNRGVGVLIAVLGAAAFALIYIAVEAVIAAVMGVAVDTTIVEFVASMTFWVPVLVYAVLAAVFALIVDRAAWWAHVLGSVFVGVLTYAISAGIILLALGVIAMTPDEAAYHAAVVFSTPWMLAALVIARETALWFGLAISARGRRVSERNAAERAAFEAAVAERRAEYERAHPAV